MIKFKYEEDGLNAAIAENSRHPEINGQVAIPSNQNVRAVSRMPRVMREKLAARVSLMWFEFLNGETGE